MERLKIENDDALKRQGVIKGMDLPWSRYTTTTPKEGPAASNHNDLGVSPKPESRFHAAKILDFKPRGARDYRRCAKVLTFERKCHSVEIVDYVDTQAETFDTLQAESERAIELLQERRTALISAAVTGKIDVRGWKAPETEAEVA